MTVIEEHANWAIARELGCNYSHAGLVRRTSFPDLAATHLKILIFWSTWIVKSKAFTFEFEISTHTHTYIHRTYQIHVVKHQTRSWQEVLSLAVNYGRFTDQPKPFTGKTVLLCKQFGTFWGLLKQLVWMSGLEVNFAKSNTIKFFINGIFFSSVLLS